MLPVEQRCFRSEHSVFREPDFVGVERASMQALTWHYQLVFEESGFAFSVLDDLRLIPDEHNEHDEPSEISVEGCEIDDVATTGCTCGPTASHLVRIFQGRPVQSALHVHSNKLPLRVAFPDTPGLLGVQGIACRNRWVRNFNLTHPCPAPDLNPQSPPAPALAVHDEVGRIYNAHKHTQAHGTHSLGKAKQQVAGSAGAAETNMHMQFVGSDGVFQRKSSPPATHPTVLVRLPVPGADIETTMGLPCEHDAYVFFDTYDHIRWRKREEHWGFREIIADAIVHSAVQPVLAVTLLPKPLPNLPRTQIVLSGAEQPPGWQTVPIDLRPVGFDICTIRVPDDSSAFEAALHASRYCSTPPRITREVAKRRWSFAPPGALAADPFRPGVLAEEPAIICQTLSPAAHSDASDTASDSDASSGSTVSSAFECVPTPTEEPEARFVVAFHSADRHPWVESFPHITTPDMLARSAARYLASQTGIAGWRTHFLWRQPYVPGIDLHCLLTPIHSSGASGTFLADFRRIFGPDIRSFAVLHALLNTPQSADAMCAVARQKLLDWGLAEPPGEFSITTARNGALLVPATTGTCMVSDTIDFISTLPGLRQHVFCASGATSACSRGTSPGCETTALASSTTTTTPTASDDLPHHVAPMTLRTPYLARLGIIGVGVFTAEFPQVPNAVELIARVWAIAIGRQEVPRGLRVQLSPCQPPNNAFHKEILIFAAHETPIHDSTVTVWIDQRPQGLIAFRNIASWQDPKVLIADFHSAKGLYLNGRRWDTPQRLCNGDLIAVSIVPQAPDLRPVDFFIQRVSGLCAFLEPLLASEDLRFETTSSLELDVEIAAAAWHSLVQARVQELGFTETPGRRFIILGPGYTATGAVHIDQWDPAALGKVAAWVRLRCKTTLGSFTLHDTEWEISHRRIFVAVPVSVDPAREYVRIHVADESAIAFVLPHAALPRELACLAPLDDPYARPVPGRPWYGPFFPAAPMTWSTRIDCVDRGHGYRDGEYQEQPIEPCEAEAGHLQRNRWQRTRLRGVGNVPDRVARHLQRLSHMSHDPACGPAFRPVTYSTDDEAPTAFALPPPTTTTTTTTATNMQVTGSPVLFLVVQGAIAGQQLTRVDFEGIAQALTDLIIAHVARNRAPAQGILRMAQSQPGGSQDYREIIMTWIPLDFHLHIVVDSRGLGGGLRVAAVDSDVDILDLIPEDLRRREVKIFINGIPEHLFHGGLQDGDLVLFTQEPASIVALPRAAIFRRWPALAVLALDILTTDFFPVAQQAELAQAQVLRAVEIAIDVRRTQLGHHLNIAQPVLIFSRIRGEIVMYIHCRLPATRGQVEEALSLIPEWKDAHRLVDTGMMSGEAPIFLAQDSFEARQCWHLVPVPYMLRLFLLWPTNEEAVLQTSDLPAPPHLFVSGCEGPAHGHVHEFRRRSLREGTSLAHIRLRQPRARQPPCDQIAAQASPARVELCRREHGLATEAVAPDHFTSHVSVPVLQNALRQGGTLGCRLDHLRVDPLPSVQLMPHDLEIATDRAFLAVVRAARPTQGGDFEVRYTIFDPDEQITIRTHQPGQRIEWLIADILNSSPKAVRAIQQLTTPVWGFPVPQFARTFEDSPAGSLAIPVDCRGAGLGVCTIYVPRLMPWSQLGNLLSTKQAETRHCQGTGDVVLDALHAQRLSLRDAHHLLQDPIASPLPHLQFIFVNIRPPTPEVPLSSASSTAGSARCPNTTADDEPAQPAGGPDRQQSENTERTSHATGPLHGVAELPDSPVRKHASVEVPTPFGTRRMPRQAKSSEGHLAKPPRTTVNLSDCVPVPQPGWGHLVTADMIQYAVEGHQLQRLHRNFHQVEGITLPVQCLWASLRVWDAEATVEALYIFTDGSFCPCTGLAAWAVVVLALQGGHVVRVGVVADKVEGPHARGAYDGEAEALLHARAVAFAQRPTPAFIGSDCASALAATHAACEIPHNDLVVKGTAGLAFASAASGQHVQCLKVQAHDGCLFNEAADNIAKAIARTGSNYGLAPSGEAFHLAVSERLFEGAWILGRDARVQAQLPSVGPDGTWNMAALTCPFATRPEAFATFGRNFQPSSKSQAVSLRIMQYNCLSLKGDLAKELMRRGLEQQETTVAGLQETRTNSTGVTRCGAFWVVHAACSSKGIGGCQVWFSVKPMRGSEGPCWRRESITIVAAQPQILVCTAQLGDITFALVSAHAPTSAAQPAERSAFWRELSGYLNALPQHYVPLITIDANARFISTPDFPKTRDSTPAVENAKELIEFGARHDLTANEQFGPDGSKLFSWRSPRGDLSLIDYIMLPAAWEQSGSTTTITTLNDLHAGKDHFPLLCHCHLHVETARPRPSRRIAPQMLHTEQGQQAVRHAFETMPIVPWHVDPTTHVDIVHTHLWNALSTNLPPEPPKPRHPAFSEHTFQLVRQTRHCRHVVRTLRGRIRRITLRAVFDALRHDGKGDARAESLGPSQATDHAPVGAVRAMRRCLMRWSGKLFAYDWSLKINADFDKAEFLRHQVSLARSAGPSAFAHHIRAILRSGRKFKAPPVLPVLRTASGAHFGEEAVQQALGDYHAQAERGKASSPSALCRAAAAPRAHLQSTVDTKAVPSIVELAAAFGQLSRGKAPGLSGIPPDAYSTAPQAAALAIWPVLAKTIASGVHPLQWTGGLAHSIPKGSKDPSTCAAWRSIMLLEADAKAVQRAFRPHLLAVFRDGRPFDQYGGVPQCPLTLPAFLARTHLAAMKTQGRCGGILFLDCTAAYYSVAREILVAPPGTYDTPGWVRTRAAELFSSEEEQAAFALKMSQGPILGKPTVPLELRRYIEGLFGSTWFTTDREGRHAWQTHSGTSPGSPIADTLFGILFSPFLTSLQKAINDAGLDAFVYLSPKESGDASQGLASSPTWADDVAVLFGAADAQAAPHALAEVARLAEELVQGIGLKFNYGPGKTEAIVAIRGPGSAQVRRDVLCTDVPCVTTRTASGRTLHVRVVESYCHLGTILSADCHEYPNLQHRRELLQQIWQPVKRRIFTNPYVTPSEKKRLLQERVFSRYLHGAGLWRLATVHERDAALEPLTMIIRGALRPILGISQQGYTVEHAAAMLDLPTPAELLTTERARALVEASGIQETAVWEAAASDGVWLAQAREALMATLRPGEDNGLRDRLQAHCVHDLLRAIRTHKPHLQRLVRAYPRRQVQKRASYGEGLRQAHSPEVTYVPIAQAGVPGQSDDGWMCARCGASYATARLLALHQWHKHRQRSEAAQVCFGTRCEVCCVEFWDSSRLQQHLKQQGRCRTVYANSDLDVPARPPAAKHRHGWRPAATVAGPQPFWALLTPG